MRGELYRIACLETGCHSEPTRMQLEVLFIEDKNVLEKMAVFEGR